MIYSAGKEDGAHLASSICLLVDCPDRKGLVAAVSGFVMKHNGNILSADQYVSSTTGRFFMRLEIDEKGFAVPRDQLSGEFSRLAHGYDMTYRISYSDRPKRVAILVSKQDHCLVDLLWRWNAGDLDADIQLVISNHERVRDRVAMYGIPFYHLPVCNETRQAQEYHMQELLHDNNIDVVILARYMQILSSEFVARWPNRIINIHHSFLPAFAGANPYRQAHERGVKVIGATAHYVTDELDAGPIILQDVTHVSHRDTPADLERLGRDVERRVLAQAVRWHLEDRVLVDGKRTVVFE